MTNQPLFNIELDHVSLDEWYPMTRITDPVTENLISEVMQRDEEAEYFKGKRREKRCIPGDPHNHHKKYWDPFSIWEKKNADGKGSGSYE